jgi:hypothetical protein
MLFIPNVEARRVLPTRNSGLEVESVLAKVKLVLLLIPLKVHV